MTVSLKNYSILISYFIGAPIGLLTVLLTFITPGALTGEGLATMALVFTYGKATLGLIITFLIGLWIGGNNIYVNLLDKKSLLYCSYKYSLTVNLIIWTTFIIITIIDNIDNFSMMEIAPPVLAFIISVTLTTFTLGLLICYIVKNKIEHAESLTSSGQ